VNQLAAKTARKQPEKGQNLFVSSRAARASGLGLFLAFFWPFSGPDWFTLEWANRQMSELKTRIVAQHRDRYVVRDGSGVDRDAVLSGRFRHQVTTGEELPAVGDWVDVSGEDGILHIRAIHPRRGAFRRKVAGDTTEVQIVAANVDLAVIATALPGDVNLRRIERYLTLAWESGAMPLVLLTKADLADNPDAEVAAVRTVAPGVDVLAISTVTGAGLDELRARLGPGITAVLLGSSGVGKSTLVNALLGAERQRTAEVRDDGAGRHTTTHRELLELPGGASLIDTPGMRELQLWSASDGFDSAFDDITSLGAECRFRDCAHESEPDCAVRAAVECGSLDQSRLASWHDLRRELAYLERKQDAAAAAAMQSQTKSATRLLRDRLKEKYN
jgi:ribosome biogenesis GTPase